MYIKYTLKTLYDNVSSAYTFRHPLPVVQIFKRSNRNILQIITIYTDTY